MRTRLAAVITIVLAMPVVVAASGPAPAPCDAVLCAGAATVDTTWHTGAGQGQLGGAGNSFTAGKFDPFHHSTKMTPTDGIQSRTYAKAIVVQGPDGTRAAYVKTELYLQQDLLTRRVAELVSGADPTSEHVVPGLDGSRIMLGGTHNHSVPHYTSTAWGVWIFADAFDFRAFEHTAQGIARAVREAADNLAPARVGAAVVAYDEIQQNILGPTTADDGSPAGFPRDHVDPELAVIRFDAVPSGEPIAALVNFGMHPESIGGQANLISSDFTGVVERVVERALGKEPGNSEGPVVAWSQGGLGDVEPDQSRAHRPNERREFWRRDFAQAERMSLELSEAVLRTWSYVASPPEDGAEGFIAAKHVPFSTVAPVDMLAYRFPGPVAHPLPTVSNCRTDRPAVPIVGFPDCQRLAGVPGGYGATVQRLREAGLPVPDNLGSAPSYTAVQEGLTIHLQALRIGEILLAACPCEPVTDMALNFKSRADRSPQLYLGWEADCDDEGGTVRCAFPSGNAYDPPAWRDVDRAAYERMRAQVRNDAAGWETDVASLGGAAEPVEPDQVHGNFTHEQLDPDTEGFTLPLMVGTANDYVGYVVTYREYQRGDHYRKALTPFGPRTADYINTRLVAMARELRGGPPPQDAREQVLEAVDDLLQAGKVRIFGTGSQLGTLAYEAALPDDGGVPGRVLAQPEVVVERFGAATFTWEGGSNYTDNPRVMVQRLVETPGPGTRRPDEVPGRAVGRPPQPPGKGVGGRSQTPTVVWQTVATQEGGEVVVSLAYAAWTSEAPLLWLVGNHTYPWTATFETFDGVAPGVYRFVVDGQHRRGGRAHPYEIVSDPFTVDVWRGLSVRDLHVAGDTARFRVSGIEAEVADEQLLPGPVDLPVGHVRYPFTYSSEVPFLDTQMMERGGWRYCFRCTFRPWAADGKVLHAAVTVRRTDGATTVHDATLVDGWWQAAGLGLNAGDRVTVEPGQVLDEHGNTNGVRATG